MISKKILATFISLLLLGGVSLAEPPMAPPGGFLGGLFGGPPPGGPPSNMHQPNGPQQDMPHGNKRLSAEDLIEKISKDLGLTQQQKNDLLSEAKQMEKETKELDQNNRTNMENVEKELAKDSPDQKAIYNYLQDISKNMMQMQLKRIGQIIELRKKLTPKQKAKFNKLMEENKKRAIKMFEKWKLKEREDKGIRDRF